MKMVLNIEIIWLYHNNEIFVILLCFSVITYFYYLIVCSFLSFMIMNFFVQKFNIINIIVALFRYSDTKYLFFSVGSFEINVNDVEVFSKLNTGSFPNMDEVRVNIIFPSCEVIDHISLYLGQLNDNKNIITFFLSNSSITQLF